MSHHAEGDRERSRLRLDRANRKVLGVCGGIARYLEVPAALVRVIYCIACLVSPMLLLAYFILYWILEDEERPDRIRAALSEFTGGGKSSHRSFGPDHPFKPDDGVDKPEAASNDRGNGRIGSLPFDIFNGPLYRSRKNIWIGGVCSGVANYLGIRPAIVRILTLLSLFILGGVMVWGYVILWIILDKEPKRRRSTRTSGDAMADQPAADTRMDIDACAQTLQTAEQRLRDVEAYMTSKQFRLHCEINRI